VSLVWLARNGSTVAVVFSSEEGGGRSVGGRWKSLPTAQRRKRCATKLWAGSRGVRPRILAQKLAASVSKVPTRSRVTFQTLVDDWKATVLPMYKHSTQKNHRHIAERHLAPWFGTYQVSHVNRKEVQAYVRASRASGIRAEDHRSHPRRAQRRAAHDRQVGSSSGQSCA
jgi:hypothetical protein